jgi:molecular chaperone GrpE
MNGDTVDPVEPVDPVEEPGPDESEQAGEFDELTDQSPDAAVDDLSAAEAEFDVDVAALVAQSDEYKSLAQRVQADFDNFRRRAQVQAQADAERATGRLAEALLPVLDAAEAAYLRYPDEVGPLLNQMLTELKKHGLEAVDLEGKPFDPEVAEAVAHEPGDGGEPVVAEVLRSGYLWKGRVLRAAMVKTRD